MRASCHSVSPRSLSISSLAVRKYASLSMFWIRFTVMSSSCRCRWRWIRLKTSNISKRGLYIIEKRREPIRRCFEDENGTADRFYHVVVMDPMQGGTRERRRLQNHIDARRRSKIDFPPPNSAEFHVTPDRTVGQERGTAMCSFECYTWK